MTIKVSQDTDIKNKLSVAKDYLMSAEEESLPQSVKKKLQVIINKLESLESIIVYKEDSE